MGYIGNEPTTGHFPVDNLTSSGGSTYTLSKAPASAGAIEVSVQGILQPTTAYSVSGTTLTLAGVANNVNIFVRHLGETLSLPTPADGSVTTSKLAVDSVDSDHIVDGSVDNAHLATGIDATKLTGTIHADRYTNTIPDATNVASAGAGMLTVDQSWTGSQRATLVTDNDGSFDMNAGQNFKCTPAAGLTLTFTNFADGQSGFIILINSGGHTIALDANSKADANLATTVTAAGTYILNYISDGTNAYLTNSAVMA